MEEVSVTITGRMPLLFHADNIEWSDQMEEWKNNPENKKKSKAGDDRTPPWRWIGCLNFDDPDKGVITVPSEYIMRSMMGGAVEIPLGKGQKTFKALSQSGLLCKEFHWPLLVNGKTIPMEEIQKLRSLKTFKEHTEAVKDLGFSLFVKRAKIGSAKHIRVRPRFDNWSATGTIIILDDRITIKVLEQIGEIAGKFSGLGDWRPGAKTPGAFGAYNFSVSG